MRTPGLRRTLVLPRQGWESVRLVEERVGDIGRTTVKKAIVMACLACVSVCTNASGQPAADCRPNALNIPGAPYPCIFPDRRVTFRVAAPEAQKVRVRLG